MGSRQMEMQYSHLENALATWKWILVTWKWTLAELLQSGDGL